jgi:hypothetical protein
MKTRAQMYANLIRRLASGYDGEVVATVRALIRALATDGRDLHHLAKVIEHDGKTGEADIKQAFEAGRKAGIVEGRKQGTAATVFRDADSKELHKIAVFVFENRWRLDRRHEGFAEDMVRRTQHSKLTPRQEDYLRSLYRQLGGDW